MGINTIIVEDEIPSLSLLRDLLRNFNEIKIIGEAMNGLEAVRMIDEKNPDLVLLDVQLPVLNGLEVIENIKNRPRIIFITAYDEYALKAFEVNAVDYVLKPISLERLEKAIKKATEMISSAKRNWQSIESLSRLFKEEGRFLERIMVKHRYEYKIIDVRNIFFFRIENGLVFAHTDDGKFITDVPLSTMIKKLNPRYFFRSHRKSIVNLGLVKKVIPWINGNYLLEFANGKRVELSRTHIGDFKSLMGA